MIKKSKAIVCALQVFLFILALSACSINDKESSKEKNETILPPLTETAYPSSTVETTPAVTTLAPTEPLTPTEPSKEPIAEVQTFAETDWGEDNQYWIRSYEPTLSLPRTDVLPDTLGKAAGRTADTVSTASRYIAALDLEIPIPEGSFLYCVSGMYKNSDGTALRMDFVDEYILTIREMTEEELVQAVYEYPQDKFGQDHVPYWVLWNFKVFHRDYYPLEQLAASRIRTSGEIRVKGEYFIAMGVTRWGLMQDGSHIPLYSPGEDPRNLSVKEKQWPLDEVRQAVIAGTQSAGVYYLDMDPVYVNGDFGTHAEVLFDNTRSVTSLWQSFPDASPASDVWWADYQSAIHELTNNAGQYRYPEIQIAFTEESLSKSPETRQMQLLFRDGWVQNETEDRTIRAFAYAWLKAIGMETELGDIAVYLKDSACGVPFYLVFRIDRNDNNQMTPLLRGIAYLNESSIEYARNYIAENWK